MRKHTLFLRSLLSLAMAVPIITVNAEEEPLEVVNHEVEFHATVTDAGQYIDSMTVDYGDCVLYEVPQNAFDVHMTSTIHYGKRKGNLYSNFDSEKAFPITNVETEGGKVTLYFDQSFAPTLTWLDEGRNYPGLLNFTIEQNEVLKAKTLNGNQAKYFEIIPDENTYSFKENATYADILDEEITQFQSVIVDNGINYQIHKGTNDSLIVWFHGNGEGDFPVKDTNNNISQVLANRGTVAWTSEEAKTIFGDSTVVSFQVPDTWYKYNSMNLLEIAYKEINDVIKENNINLNKVYVSGCSAGGFMTIRMMIQYPNLFKAAMINCPAIDIADVRAGITGAIPTDEELKTIKDSKTGIWLVQGETDSSVNPINCSERIWNILSQNEDVEKNTFDNGMASSFTTYETNDNKYKMTLYETVDQKEITDSLGEKRLAGKILVEEDYDRDGVYTSVKYNDHWTWIYSLRNNPRSEDGTNIWNWAKAYTDSISDVEGNEKVLKGTHTVVVDGDDWGPAVVKTIVKLGKEIVNVQIDKVSETKEVTQLIEPDFPHGLETIDRKIESVYLSDREGNRVEGVSDYFSIEMYVSPKEGSPFIYDIKSGKNDWCNTYILNVLGTVKDINGNEYTLDTGDNIYLKDNKNRICPNVDDVFNVSNDYHGIQYGEFVPKTNKDNKKALVIWLHGAGEGGDDNYIDLLGNKVTALAQKEFQDKFDGGAYIITPQCDTMWMDDGNGNYQNGDIGSMYADDLFGLIDSYIKNHKDIDPSRIIIGGCSNGGYMTMEMVIKHPDYFYKAFPICEAFVDEYISDEQIKAIKNGGTEFWFTYARNDDTVDPLKTSIPTITRMQEAGITVHVSEWEDVHDTTNRFVNEDGTPYQYAGHWSWTYFDNNMNYCLDCKENEWDWMAEYRKTSSNNVIPNGNGANTGDGLALFNGLTTISSVIGIAGLFLLKKKIK